MTTLINQKFQMPYLRPTTMDNLLVHNSFSIPRYQRRYSWGSDECDDLLNDIMEVVKGRQASHFFGSIVTYTPRHGNQMVIDGQQRITTSMLLLAVLRDLAKILSQKMSKEFKFKNPKVFLGLQKVETDANVYLFGTQTYNKESTMTLHIRKPFDKSDDKQNYANYLRGLIVKDGTASKYEDVKYRPIQLLRLVHRKLRRDITKILNKCNTLQDKEQILLQIFTSFTSKFYIILMEAPTSADALTIYMTLNNRGKDLTTADIVKGQLAGALEQDESKATVAMNNWDKMSKNMQSNAKVISGFLKQYWEARFSYESKGDLARSIVHQINTPNEAESMISDLLELSPVYNTLTNTTSKSVFKFGPLNNIIKTLHAMRLVQYYPVVLALYHRNYSERDIYAVVKDIGRIEMRHLLKHFAHTKYGNESNVIWNSSNKLSASQIINDLNSKQLINDADTKDAGKAYQHKYAKSGKGIATMMYMISKIYAYENNDFNNGNDIYDNVLGTQNFSVVRLSHQNINNNLDDMGNWTILEKDLCEEANKDRSFNSLYTALNKSKLESNKKLAKSLKEFNGNIDTLIDKRQNKFATDYIRVW